MKLKEERIEANFEDEFNERILPRIQGKAISKAEWLGDGIALKLSDGTTLFVWGLSGPGGEGAGVKVELEPKKSLYLLSEFAFELEDEEAKIYVRKILPEEKKKIIEKAKEAGVQIIETEKYYEDPGMLVKFVPTFKPGDEAIIETGEIWHLVVEGKEHEK